ncbi:MAG: hypothetical protein ACKODT_07250 [Fluviibacter sp.]
MTFTEQGVTYRGVVDVQRRGWVMIDLDEPVDTRQGWHASKMMFKAAQVQLAKDVDGVSTDGDEEQGQQ